MYTSLSGTNTQTNQQHITVNYQYMEMNLKGGGAPVKVSGFSEKLAGAMSGGCQGMCAGQKTGALDQLASDIAQLREEIKAVLEFVSNGLSQIVNGNLAICNNTESGAVQKVKIHGHHPLKGRAESVLNDSPDFKKTFFAFRVKFTLLEGAKQDNNLAAAYNNSPEETLNSFSEMLEKLKLQFILHLKKGRLSEEAGDSVKKAIEAFAPGMRQQPFGQPVYYGVDRVAKLEC
ncbi:MAG: hypothetical protein HQK83_05330 [Fibrobacteria bacterium]|nr:hypothetical protein [Fibrobacteria bacterium]